MKQIFVSRSTLPDFEHFQLQANLLKYIAVFPGKYICNGALARPLQWSPCNPEGKKQYDRDFLYDLAKAPMSLVKPTNLPSMSGRQVELNKAENAWKPGTKNADTDGKLSDTSV